MLKRKLNANMHSGDIKMRGSKSCLATFDDQPCHLCFLVSSQWKKDMAIISPQKDLV